MSPVRKVSQPQPLYGPRTRPFVIYHSKYGYAITCDCGSTSSLASEPLKECLGCKRAFPTNMQTVEVTL